MFYQKGKCKIFKDISKEPIGLFDKINIFLPRDITDVESKVSVWPEKEPFDERPLDWWTGCNLGISVYGVNVWSDMFHSSFFVLLKGKPK